MLTKICLVNNNNLRIVAMLTIKILIINSYIINMSII